MTQALTRRFLAGAVVLSLACGGGASNFATAPAPVDPVTTVSRFMAAVADTNLVAMANLWGTDDGPMIGRMDPDQLRMRLTVMQRYLRHDRYELRDEESSLFASQEGRRHYQVRVQRNGCVVDIPIELVLVGRGWLVTNVDLEAAGNPARRCR